ncbi:anti-sigma factor antagonist [Qaidamihabitans albus]|uniref:anti-sigma factor antagonist n=1 Tax=Qaidamihabitans albus TaxID=2795733 RepID=UPI0027DD031F|nr:anti-sigma factor antagonist [Qaidamihabitans albus]
MRSTESTMFTTQSTTVPEQEPAPVTAHAMHIDVEHRPEGVVLARISGEVDLLSAPELRKFVEKTSPDDRLVLDLDGLGFLGSAGLSVLAELAEQWARRACPWAVVATSRVVRRPLEATGLIGQLPVHPTTETAVRAVTTAG